MTELKQWGVHVSDKVHITDDDFTHDVWLLVRGDFATQAGEIAYAENIASRLNRTLDPDTIDRCVMAIYDMHTDELMGNINAPKDLIDVARRLEALKEDK